MKYIPVTGLQPPENIKGVILKQFDAALISIAEPTTSKGWTLHSIYKQTDKIFKNFEGRCSELYLDSGGFQFIQGYLTKRRAKEYIDTYHFLMEKFKDKNMRIFSLDIQNRKMSNEELHKFNDYSIDESKQLLNKYPSLKDKQLFVIQSRFPDTLKIWKEFMDRHEVLDVWKRYSFGGLVGLKKDTNTKHNHFVPMTMWLLSYAKNQNKLNNIQHIHMLGQSSRLAIITSFFMEEVLKNNGINIEITMDSSEVLRFSPIMQKLPIMFKNVENDFQMARTSDDVIQMLKNIEEHNDEEHSLEETITLFQEEKKLETVDLVGLLCHGIDTTMEFAQYFIDTMKEDLQSDEWKNWDVDFLKEKFTIFQQGRLAVEFINNLKYFQYGLENIDDFDKLHNYTLTEIQNYYS